MFEAKIHIDSDDERTLPQDVAPLSESDDRRMSQQRQLIPRKWISEDEWINYVQADLDVAFGPQSAVPTSIFTVPNSLKDTKREAYVPRRVSLGPYHHGSAELHSMDHHKGRALRTMMTRSNINMDFANRASYEIRLLENEIRYSYEESIDCNGETLARMLCLDGCFLLEVLRSLGKNGLAGDVASEWYSPPNTENKIMFSESDTVKDILMLENQVPFIVLLKLLQLELNPAVDVENYILVVLVKTTRGLFTHFDDRIFDIDEWVDWLYWSGLVTKESVPVKHLHHLLGFLHRVIVSPPIFYRRLEGGECSITIPHCCLQCIECCPSRFYRCLGGECSINIKHCCWQCIKCCSNRCIRKVRDRYKTARDGVPKIRPAVELRNAGIRFKPCEGGIQDIDFDENSATIFLPPIRVTCITEVLFRNLIAFEMCQPLEINYVSYYVNLMDNLIDSEEDVALLIGMGVLINWVGRNKEVVDLFKGLRRAAPVNLSHAFGQLTRRVHVHYEVENQIRVQLQFPELVSDYFSSPWKASASVAAIVLLLLTLAQTIFTAMQTFK